MFSITVVAALTIAMPQVPPVGAGSAVPPDTYEAQAVRDLVERAAAARAATGEGIASYEAEIRDRIYVGLGGGVFRRERTLFEQARSARVLWTREGHDIVQWTGAQRRIPMAGMDTSDDRESLEEFAWELARGERPIAMLDPREDILSFGDDGEARQLMLHPLSDTAAAHYQYFAGDTLTLSFVGDEAPVRLSEVTVRPRRSDPRLVAGSLWFDLDTGQLARASFRPARPFNLVVDFAPDTTTAEGRRDREDQVNIPGFIQPLEFEVRYMTIEYSLHERQWWLPRRFAFEGEARAGRWLGVPFLIETTLTGYEVNPVEPELTREMGDLEGWRVGVRRTDEEGDSTIAMTPPLDSLDTTGLLGSLDRLEMGAIVFDPDEISRIRGELEQIVGQVPIVRRPSLNLFGLGNGLSRFNRVEGLSMGASMTLPLSALVETSLTARIGVADWEPRGELRAERALDEYSVHWSAYRRLADGSDFDDPLDTSSSVKALFTGKDRGQYYDTYGTEVGLDWRGRSVGIVSRAFIEEHQAVPVETSFHLFKPITGAHAPLNIVADEGRVGGVAATLKWFSGTDPTGLSVWGSITGEAASGDFEYQRALATLGASFPTVGRLATGMEVGAGTSWGEVPVQRLHFIGGANTVRGFRESHFSGTSFWFGRAEAGSAFPLFRIAVFGDIGWAGPKQEFGFEDPWAGVGIGLSTADGLIRLDAARGVRRGELWRLYLYLDGIL